MSICLPMVMAADAIVLLPGWERSDGATAEMSLATKLEKEVILASDQ